MSAPETDTSEPNFHRAIKFHFNAFNCSADVVVLVVDDDVSLWIRFRASGRCLIRVGLRWSHEMLWSSDNREDWTGNGVTIKITSPVYEKTLLRLHRRRENCQNQTSDFGEIFISSSFIVLVISFHFCLVQISCSCFLSASLCPLLLFWTIMCFLHKTGNDNIFRLYWWLMRYNWAPSRNF